MKKIEMNIPNLDDDLKERILISLKKLKKDGAIKSFKIKEVKNVI